MAPGLPSSPESRLAPVRILVLGATGMLGHKLAQSLAARGHKVAALIRSSSPPDTPAGRAAFVNVDQIIANVDVLRDEMLEDAFARSRPEVVINAVGIIKQLDIAKDPVATISTNSLLPHRLASLCRRYGSRLIQISTDCVFAGHNGPYGEASATDAEDLYGRSKLLGEVTGPQCLTIRSSIVGRELRGRTSLVEWFLSQHGGSATGFSGALYTGLTTNVMSDLIGQLITKHPDLTGVWHVASNAISKYELLTIINKHFDLGIALARDDKFMCDRRLDGRRFQSATGFVPPTWEAMVAEMRADPTPYGG